VVEVSKSACPLCKRPFPHLTLRSTSTLRAWPLDSGTVIVGRAELGGSLKVSARHATFRRVGPETWIESHSSNGTYRWDGSSWARLPEKRPLLVQSGDRLRLGDTEVHLE
jgi:pSer/pThr/pTyr-binding forkhead associated (FHA) protein